LRAGEMIIDLHFLHMAISRRQIFLMCFGDFFAQSINKSQGNNVKRSLVGYRKVVPQIS